MLSYVIDKLVGLAPALMNANNTNRQNRDAALKAISKALVTTQIYLKETKIKEDRNSDKEAEIAQLWIDASIPIRHYDRELAEICKYKCEYWIDSTAWDDNRIDKFGIRISKVKEQFNALMEIE